MGYSFIGMSRRHPLSYRWRALCGAWGMMSQTNGGSDQRGLAALVMLLRFQGLSVDPGQIRHQLGTDAVGVPEMLRCANQLGLKARELRTRWDRLPRTPLPGIAVLRDGGFLLLGRASEDKIP